MPQEREQVSYYNGRSLLRCQNFSRKNEQFVFSIQSFFFRDMKKIRMGTNSGSDVVHKIDIVNKKNNPVLISIINI